MHNDVFGARSPPETMERNNPTNQAGIGRSSYKTPKRVRENDTTKSSVLSEIKPDRLSKSQGKRTYPARPTIHPGQTVKPSAPNPHRIPDHKGEWFFASAPKNETPR